MSVTVNGREVSYTGLVAPWSHEEAVRVAHSVAARTGRRMRVHRTPVPDWGRWAAPVGWHICEVGTCRKDQA